MVTLPEDKPWPEPPPGSRADLEVKISWSRLRDWSECSEKAHLLSQGLKSPVTDYRNFFHGTVVDRCMRTWLDQDEPEPGQMAAASDRMFDAALEQAKADGDGVVKWRHPADQTSLRIWCRDLVTRLEPILYKEVIPYDYQPALRFKVPISVPRPDGGLQRIWLRGEFDILCRAERTVDQGRLEVAQHAYHIWDLKGTSDDQYWRKVTGQLVFYDIAVKVLLGEWPAKSGLIQPMCKQPVLSFTFTDEHRRQMLTRIVKMAESMWRNDHRPKDSNAGCQVCPVKHACPKWRVSGKRAPVAGVATT